MEFSDLNWALVAPLIGIQLLLIIIALVDLSKVEQTNGPKWMWALITLFISILGPILYFIFGKKHS
ncbi:PLD nuclease N-terminal domain-containing protein [Neobacillus sp. SAB-20_R2A]|uniref:PLD nuclease N-terminal domain-containing protein n=1 Tax=Neobacillus sp. SAB-20_R2A TaxID=3120519 RepID=UPI003C6E6F31